jgi:hypothetical protein
MRMGRIRNEQKSTPKKLVLNLAIVILGAIVMFLLYSFVNTTIVHTPVENKTESKGVMEHGEIIQLDVLNGCGVSGIAQRLTEYLRKRKFDVVQMSNYKSYDVVESLVIDRVGDMKTARKVAHALGIQDRNIITELNPDYYLHVSVVIGRDYQALKPYQ